MYRELVIITVVLLHVASVLIGAKLICKWIQLRFQFLPESLNSSIQTSKLAICNSMSRYYTKIDISTYTLTAKTLAMFNAKTN